MGGNESKISAKDAQHIVLETKKRKAQYERKILVDNLRTQLTAMTMVDDPKPIPEPPTTGASESEQYLNLVSQKIMNRVSDESMIWESDPEETFEYLKAVVEVRILTEKFESSCSNKDVMLLRKARDVLQIAMVRLGEEFEQIIVQHSQPFELGCMSFRAREGAGVDSGPYSLEDLLQRKSIGKYLEDLIVDLVHPEVIPDLKCIANLMFISNYDRECSQAFVNARKHVLSRCLFVLEVELLSIDDVLKMEWDNLDSQIKRWVWAIEFVKGYLVSEKRLSDEIFGDFGSLIFLCLTDLSKAAVMQMLSFGGAVAVRSWQPEKLFRVLDMYKVLAELHPDINSLYADQAVKEEFCEVLRRLGDAVRATFLKFKNAFATDAASVIPLWSGTHPLTQYVMNYLHLLTDYRDALNQILEEAEREESLAPSAESVAFMDEVKQFDGACNATTPVAFLFQFITSTLIANINEESKLCKDPALQHFFLMNNIHYMVQKVKDSELRDIFGVDWIKRHKGKCQQQAMKYERATWSSILSLFKDDESSSIKNVLRERLRSFYAAFEEVYRNQTGWLINDPQLQEDLQISTSLKVIPAYRSFVRRHPIGVKYFKYTSDDLENYILDLFSGSQRSLYNK